MYSSLTYSKPLAGILALSSWLPLHNLLEEVCDTLASFLGSCWGSPFPHKSLGTRLMLEKLSRGQPHSMYKANFKLATTVRVTDSQETHRG